MEEIVNIFLVLIVLLFFVASIALGVQTYNLGVAKQQLEHYRTELSAAADRQQDALNTIRECYRNVGRTGEVLSQSVSTIQDTRRQISEIRKNYEDMENRLLQFYVVNGSTGDSNSGDKVRQ